MAAPHRRDHACSDTDHTELGGIDVLEVKEALGLQQLEEVRHLLGIEVALEDLGIALGRIDEDGPTITVDLGGRNTIDLRVRRHRMVERVRGQHQQLWVRFIDFVHHDLSPVRRSHQRGSKRESRRSVRRRSVALQDHSAKSAHTAAWSEALFASQVTVSYSRSPSVESWDSP